jgi:hypothetical protein
MGEMEDIDAIDIIRADDSQSLAESVAAHHGLPHRFLLLLLKDSERPASDISRAVGVKPETYFRWRHRVPGFKATVDRIRQGTDSLRLAYSQAILEASVNVVSETMVARASSITHKDGQRAAERILETTGVLSKLGIDLGQVDSVDMIALSIRSRRTAPVATPYVVGTTDTGQEVDSPKE